MFVVFVLWSCVCVMWCVVCGVRYVVVWCALCGCVVVCVMCIILVAIYIYAKKRNTPFLPPLLPYFNPNSTAEQLTISVMLFSKSIIPVPSVLSQKTSFS